jgi:hypothetical protein
MLWRRPWEADSLGKVPTMRGTGISVPEPVGSGLGISILVLAGPGLHAVPLPCQGMANER